jgi:hypothetical protein
MSDDLDALESELSALEPVAISPELRRGIAQRLVEVKRPSRVSGRQGRWWLTAVAGGLIAACLAVIAVHLVDNRPHPSVVVITQPTPSHTAKNSVNSLLSYERAFAHSTDEFEALLDREARTGAPVNDDAANDGTSSVSVLNLSDPKVNALIGAE